MLTEKYQYIIQKYCRSGNVASLTYIGLQGIFSARPRATLRVVLSLSFGDKTQYIISFRRKNFWW